MPGTSYLDHSIVSFICDEDMAVWKKLCTIRAVESSWARFRPVRPYDVFLLVHLYDAIVALICDEESVARCLDDEDWNVSKICSISCLACLALLPNYLAGFVYYDHPVINTRLCSWYSWRYASPHHHRKSVGKPLSVVRAYYCARARVAKFSIT